MDLEAARKALSKRSTFYSKRTVFFGVVGLCLVAGVLLRLGFVPQSEVELNAPVTGTPSPPLTATPAVEATKSVSQPVWSRMRQVRQWPRRSPRRHLP